MWGGGAGEALRQHKRGEGRRDKVTKGAKKKILIGIWERSNGDGGNPGQKRTSILEYRASSGAGKQHRRSPAASWH
jgi:hypothetical protein